MERQELLEALGKGLREVDAVVVEGARDEEALHSLFPWVNVVRLNTGRDMVSLAEELSSLYARILVLTDFDRKGRILGRRLSHLLRSMGVAVDDALRREFASLGLVHVEELPAVIERIAAQ